MVELSTQDGVCTPTHTGRTGQPSTITNQNHNTWKSKNTFTTSRMAGGTQSSPRLSRRLGRWLRHDGHTWTDLTPAPKTFKPVKGNEEHYKSLLNMFY